jgi:ribosomally synthesized peptide (plantazolicin-class)
MNKILEMADDVEAVEMSFHGEESSYFEPTAARCSSSSTCTCCCTG